MSFEFNFAMFNSSNWNLREWKYFSFYNNNYAYLNDDKWAVFEEEVQTKLNSVLILDKYKEGLQNIMINISLSDMGYTL